MTNEELLSRAREIAASGDPANVTKTDAEMIAFLLDNCTFTVSEDAVFFGKVSCADADRKIQGERTARYSKEVYSDELRAGSAARAYTGATDFGHTAPLWDDVFRLGLCGLRERAVSADEPLDPDFPAAEACVFDAAIRFVLRAAETAQEAGKTAMAAGLRALAIRPPETLFEAMQMIFVWYALQHTIEGTNLRTLGRLDRLFDRFLPADGSDGLFDAFMRELDGYRVAANLPFMLCGSDADGHDAVNMASYAILLSYIRVKPAFVKLHLLCTENTPDDFIRLALDGIRGGANSIVFMNDAVVIRALEKLGESHDAARDYSVVGCYECGGWEETACTCNGRVNVPKAIELALHGGHDALTGVKIGADTPAVFDSFEALYDAFRTQLAYLVKQSMKITNAYEAHYAEIHASPFFSATYPSCVEKGGDVYVKATTPYPNSSINALGLATAADSLAAIRKIVWEDRMMTAAELVSVLDGNWEGKEVLRGVVQRKFPKYGTGDESVDALAARIVQDLSDLINNVPNAKGGVYRLGLFSIDWRLDFGAHTAASADGRKSGEPLSQNTGATFGCDREGATAHLLSVTRIDAENVANGAIVDLDLHASAVQGESGLAAMDALLKTYLAQGGFAVHCNVLDTATLRDAMEHPNRYPNLQVRLCGWNVRFTELSRSAQEEFIRRSEAQAG